MPKRARGGAFVPRKRRRLVAKRAPKRKAARSLFRKPKRQFGIGKRRTNLQNIVRRTLYQTSEPRRHNQVYNMDIRQDRRDVWHIRRLVSLPVVTGGVNHLTSRYGTSTQLTGLSMKIRVRYNFATDVNDQIRPIYLRFGLWYVQGDPAQYTDDVTTTPSEDQFFMPLSRSSQKYTSETLLGTMTWPSEEPWNFPSSEDGVRTVHYGQAHPKLIKWKSMKLTPKESLVTHPIETVGVPTQFDVHEVQQERWFEWNYFPRGGLDLRYRHKTDGGPADKYPMNHNFLIGVCFNGVVGDSGDSAAIQGEVDIAERVYFRELGDA